jgi:ADP-ribosylglycohydrolase
VGDALGAPVEFLKLAEIRARFGRGGVTELEAAYGRRGAITDDTQMTLFTADALIRAHHRYESKGICSVPAVAAYAYRRWLETQGEPSPTPIPARGWIDGIPELRSRRGPGNTCLRALRSGTMGKIDEPINDSKGCGGVMRMAPVGLVALEPFRLGCELAAITHGHPSGYLSSGALAEIVSAVLGGASLEDAVRGTLETLAPHRGHEETTAAIERALALAANGKPSASRVESLGGGWVGEEALAIALYCALVADDLEHGITLAVNHGGDSDSTGAIAGNLLGVIHGRRAIPRRWLEVLELRQVIANVADDLWTHFGGEADGRCDDHDRYPPA